MKEAVLLAIPESHLPVHRKGRHVAAVGGEAEMNTRANQSREQQLHPAARFQLIDLHGAVAGDRVVTAHGQLATIREKRH